MTIGAIGAPTAAPIAMLATRGTSWANLLAGFLFTSAIGQAIGMMAGLIYVRTLPVEEYAFYALCLATLSFVSIMSDLGVTGSTTYFWRKAKRHHLAFSGYLAPIRRMRVWLLVLAGAAASVTSLLIAVRHGVAVWEAAAGLALVMLTARLGAIHIVNQQILRLSGHFTQVYFGDFVGQGIRLVMAIALFAGVAVSSLWALAGGFAGAAASLRFSRTRARWALQMAPQGTMPQQPSRELMRYLGPVAPGVTVFALQDTLVLWLAAAWGGTSVVASVYALGRIGAIFAIASSFLVGVIVPRLATNSDDRRFGQVAWRLRAALLAGVLAAMAVAVVYPGAPLWLIGRNYAHLEAEVPIVVAIAGFNLMASAGSVINRARGWVRIEAPLAIVHGTLVAVLAANWTYASADSVLLLMLAVSASHFLLHFCVSLTGTFRPNWVQL